ncbi:serine hydrolase-domain-containing protein [Astrocystis sublimbata]|nr:serine hydrolase-domain-containing protein [Astrocystis sublimbata]
MHTLMLHGHATSAFIFKAQTGQFRSKLDKSFTFDFVDAPIPSELPASLKRVFKTAFTWIDEKRDVESVRDTAHWLLQYMEQNGPYDCVCCFSQSAAIRAAENILHARTNDLQNLANVMTLMSKGTAGMWKDTSALLHDASSLPPKNDCFGLISRRFPGRHSLPGCRRFISTARWTLFGCQVFKWRISAMRMRRTCTTTKGDMTFHARPRKLAKSLSVKAVIKS